MALTSTTFAAIPVSRSWHDDPNDEQPRGSASPRAEPLKGSAAVAQFAAQRPAEHAWLVARAPEYGFAFSLLGALRKWGSLTPNQEAALGRWMARDQARVKTSTD